MIFINIFVFYRAEFKYLEIFEMYYMMNVFDFPQQSGSYIEQM